jgi:hypothetical protein
MKNLTVNISETDFIKYGFQQETLSFCLLIPASSPYGMQWNTGVPQLF